jgi:hypothetical protein
MISKKNTGLKNFLKFSWPPRGADWRVPVYGGTTVLAALWMLEEALYMPLDSDKLTLRWAKDGYCCL